MKLISYWQDGIKQTGIMSEQDQGIIPLAFSLKEAIAAGVPLLWEVAQQYNGKLTTIEQITFAPCVPKDAKIICVGLNYRKHAEESGAAVPSHPILFNKFSNALTAHGSPVVLPKVAVQYDYEAELGVVIGRRAKNVSIEDALDYVFGYCNINDLSARDLQMRTSQWLTGKSLDGFCPAGPYLVSAAT